jgi:hypothetical protein
MSELEDVRRKIQVAEADLEVAKVKEDRELILKREERLNLLLRKEERMVTG